MTTSPFSCYGVSQAHDDSTDTPHLPAGVVVSVAQTVSYPRTACNVLEQLSGVTERRMIVPMTVRPQQRYDHRLRHLIQRTGDVTIATDLGVPRSTAVVRHNAIGRPVLRNNSVRRFLTSTKRPNDLNALQKLNLQC